jgi:acetylornithine deacetylase/succinyl-diaminopimelate desuccinylase-like protein
VVALSNGVTRGGNIMCGEYSSHGSMSHYDVVPAPNSTFDRWTHGPFSGYVDDTYVWGRGASDDKTLLVAQCE